MSRYSMRLMQPKDMTRLIQLQAEQNRRDGTIYPLPRMFQPSGLWDTNIAYALTVEKAGEVVQGIYFQSKIAEMCFAGCDPRATAFARQQIEPVGFALRMLGYEAIRCLVPNVRAEQLTKPLLSTGFRRSDERFRSFFLEL